MKEEKSGSGLGFRISKRVFTLDEDFSNTDFTSIRDVTRSQLDLLGKFYNMALSHSERSFRVALFFASLGVMFLIVAIGFILLNRLEITYITIIAAVLVEVIASINFFLYRITKSSLIDAQSRLDITQRFLLANIVCDSLEGDYKQRVRSELIKAFSTRLNEKCIATYYDSQQNQQGMDN